MAGNYRMASEGQGNGVVMGYFHEKSRHDVRYKHAKSGPLPCHLCSYPDIVIGI
jgi:hypothetical protein